MTDSDDAADIAESTLANEPIDSADSAEPMLPTLRTEPTEPIDSAEFVEQMLRIELRERKLQREPLIVTTVSMSTWCQCRCHDGRVTARTREQLFDAYETTIVSIEHPEEGWTDPALVAVARRQGAVVMTAWNPGFARPAVAENIRANERLRAELEELGYVVWRADGRAPDGSEHEPGWIVWGMAVDQGLAVAARHGQFAIYVYDDAGRRETRVTQVSSSVRL